jgi:hypothetical protein
MFHAGQHDLNQRFRNSSNIGDQVGKAQRAHQQRRRPGTRRVALMPAILPACLAGAIRPWLVELRSEVLSQGRVQLDCE